MTIFSPGTGFIAEGADGTAGIGADTAGVECRVTWAQEQSEKEIMESNNRSELRPRERMEDHLGP